MEESGVELVDRYFSWVYFRKKSNMGSFEIFSDYTSRIKQYWKVVKLLGLILVLNFIIAIINLTTDNLLNMSISTLNWLVVIGFPPVIISHIISIQKLHKEKQLFDI